MFEHGKRTLVAEIGGSGDGQPVLVFECRWPATFVGLEVLSGPNSVGEAQPGFEVAFGSGSASARLAGEVAKAIAAGMLTFKNPEATASAVTSTAGTDAGSSPSHAA